MTAEYGGGLYCCGGSLRGYKSGFERECDTGYHDNER